MVHGPLVSVMRERSKDGHSVLPLRRAFAESLRYTSARPAYEPMAFPDTPVMKCRERFATGIGTAPRLLTQSSATTALCCDARVRREPTLFSMPVLVSRCTVQIQAGAAFKEVCRSD